MAEDDDGELDAVLLQARTEMAVRRRAQRRFALIVPPGYAGDLVRAVAVDGTAWQCLDGEWLQMKNLPEAEPPTPLSAVGIAGARPTEPRK